MFLLRSVDPNVVSLLHTQWLAGDDLLKQLLPKHYVLGVIIHAGHMTIIQNVGVTTAYHTVDDIHVMEVNGSILPMLPGSFLREKEPGYEE